VGVQKFNHIGLCVGDLERSQRFYIEALEFTYDRELTVDGEGPSQLLRVPTPLTLKAMYLVRDGFTLELLYYPQPGTEPYRDRKMNEPGLTHISLNVTDIDQALTKVSECGGEVLEDTSLGSAVFVRDPDGQLIELLQTQ
jgi:lactoylglutathione lyase